MPISDLTGTSWIISGSVSDASFPSPVNDVTFDIDFTSNGSTYATFNFIQRNGIKIVYGTTPAWTEESGWMDQAYRMISITGGNDATDSTLINWLEDNAVQVPVVDLTDTTWVFKDTGVNGAGNGSSTVEFSNISFKIDGTLADSTYIDSPRFQSPYVMMTCSILVTTGSKVVYYLKTTDYVYSQLNLTDGEGWYEGFGQNVSKMASAPTIEFVGGTGIGNPNLIVWLTQNATYQVPVAANTYELTHSLTNLSHGNVAFTVVPDTGYALPSAVSVSNGTLVSYDNTTGVIVVSGDGATITVDCQSAIVIDPVLENNSWEVIKQVCQAGNAGDYWALGDTKNISVTLGGTLTNIPHAIVDMTANRYEYASDSTKHSNVVFQAVPTIGDFQFNPSSNTSPNGDGAYNGWDYSDLRTSMNSGTIYGYYDSSFTALLEQVKTMAAYSGKTDTLVYSSDKLFLPAAREVKANYANVQSCEVNSEQTQYGYYAQNSDADANRIKYPYNSQSATYWWLRSPNAGRTYHVRVVYSDGDLNYYFADYNLGIAPCFAF